MGFQFEKGPRIFKPAKSRELLSFIDLLGLTPQIEYAQGSNDRYLCLDEILHKLPSGPLGLLTSKLTRDLVFRIFKELAIDPHPVHDESIAAFITRRFGSNVLDRLFDPLVQGIYAVDPGLSSVGMLSNAEKA
jgi:oxygen-dependent protoporphyrinogen oxidase